jgi:hypothetical protein
MMSKTNLAIFLGMLVLSFPMMLCAETPKISEEVLAAKSIATLVRLVDPIGAEPDGFKDLLVSKLWRTQRKPIWFASSWCTSRPDRRRTIAMYDREISRIVLCLQ